MKKFYFPFLLALLSVHSYGQLQLGRDTICVVENGYTLKMPWANGINYANFSNIDLNFDGKKDLVAFDRLNQFGTGRFRCFVNKGNAGETKYEPCLDCSYYFPQVVSNWALLLDYNCDGKEDLFCSTSAGIKVYKNVSVAPTLSFQLITPLIYTNIIPNGTPLFANLYTSTNGLPGIGDVDNDGDLDVLTFSPQGSLVQYYKNLAVETYSTCQSDSLHFELRDNCWGKFSEGNCSVTFGQQCQQPRGLATDSLSKIEHAGATLTIFDSDGDGDKDLILGDVSCNTIEYLHNTGGVQNPLITDTTKLYPNYPNKGNTTQIKINNFPCVYMVDVDGDNIKDLIAAPNVFGSENTRSVWYYNNVSTTNTVNFKYVKNNFLQEDMIDVGQNAFPVVFDYDGDGRKDLLVGTFGYYNTNYLNSQLTLYRNVGSPSQPSYSLITRDYAGLSTYSLNNVMPTVGDVDKDGDLDILVGTSSGQIHWLKNSAGGGNPCNFSTYIPNAFSFTTSYAVAAPQLFDINGDGNLDLMIGTKNGSIAYYKNIGSGMPFVPSFTLVTNFLGAVNVQGNSNLYGLDGYAAPFFYNDGGSVKLLVGSVSGAVFYYSVPPDITTPFYLLAPAVNFYNEGAQSVPCFEDLNNDNKRDLIIGNAAGGLTYFSSTSTITGLPDLSAQELSSRLRIYPNPSNGLLTINTGISVSENTSLVLYDALGREAFSASLASGVETVDIGSLSKGIYFAKVSVSTKQQISSTIKKIIKE